MNENAHGKSRCPCCGLYKKITALLCFPCFCRLPNGYKYMLCSPSPQRRAMAMDAVLHYIAQQQERKARQSNMFPGG